MRKVLLATTALVGVAFAGAAHAASTSPISLNVGGYTDFVAGLYHESQATSAKGGRTSRDFETEYKINFDAVGKGSNGIEYGANVSLWNGPEAANLWAGGGTAATINSAYVWLSGAFGKVMMGDAHGATDLFVYAPTVGEGQIDGRYQDFVDPTTLARFYASGVDNTEHSTKITYYTPKVGNDMNKVQLGVTYTPNMYDYGSNVAKYSTAGAVNGTVSPYQDVLEGAVEYWGNFHPVTVALSADLTTGSAGANGAVIPAMFANTPGAAAGAGGNFQDYTTFGLGGQVGFSGFTLGGSYVDEGRYGTVHGQNGNQDVWTVGGKYEFDKVGVGVSYLTGSGYDNLLLGAATTPAGTNYVKGYNALGAGAVYTWFPGLTSNADGVIFRQTVSNQANSDDGYVLLVSQRLAF